MALSLVDVNPTTQGRFTVYDARAARWAARAVCLCGTIGDARASDAARAVALQLLRFIDRERASPKGFAVARFTQGQLADALGWNDRRRVSRALSSLERLLAIEQLERGQRKAPSLYALCGYSLLG